jgi:hypothetical protein
MRGTDHVLSLIPALHNVNFSLSPTSETFSAESAAMNACIVFACSPTLAGTIRPGQHLISPSFCGTTIAPLACLLSHGCVQTYSRAADRNLLSTLHRKTDLSIQMFNPDHHPAAQIRSSLPTPRSCRTRSTPVRPGHGESPIDTTAR